MVLEVKALVMDSPMPHSFLHQIVCDVVDKSKRLTMVERVCDSYMYHTRAVGDIPRGMNRLEL